MELSNGTNTISDVRFAAALQDMQERHSDEYEVVHNGSGRSEEMPSQLRDRQNREERQLYDDRKNLGIAEWLKSYPDNERTHFLQAHESIDDEIIKGLERLSEIRGRQPRINELQAEDRARPTEQQQQAIEGLSDKELVRALEMAARSPSALVDLDQVRKELREESRQGGDRGSSAETRGAFHQRYQTERANAYQARKEAEQEVHDRFATYQAQARGFFSLRHEQEKLGARKGSERHDAHELVKAQQRGDRVEVQKQKSQQIAEARSAHPVLTWESFVQREAQLGNKVAQNVLERLQEREQSNSLER